MMAESIVAVKAAMKALYIAITLAQNMKGPSIFKLAFDSDSQ